MSDLWDPNGGILTINLKSYYNKTGVNIRTS